MLFQLPSFLLFFAIFCLFFVLCPKRARLALITVASLVFYAWWYPPYLALLLSQIVGCWLLLRLVWRNPRWLPFAVIVALTPLLLFKYADFVFRTIQALTGAATPRFGWALPLAISFVTFTIISYLIDTARQPEKKPPQFWPTSVYLTFFPHLIAGPILRAHHILPQLPHIRIDRAAFVPNLALFAVGMLKKVLVADPVGAYVDQLFLAHASLTGWQGAAAIFGFTIQIYCDFSAYSDMAIALAGMLGVQFPENFRSPYISTSLSEIWQRWHITLSFWLRDYVFKPLHRRSQNYARHFALIATMMVSGLWHGAAWTFVLWGLLQGLAMVAERVTGYNRFSAGATGWRRAVCIAWTFLLWSFLAVIFRSPDLAVAYDVSMGAFSRGLWSKWPVAATVPVCAGIALLVLHPLDQVEKIRAAARRLPPLLLSPVLLMLILGCALVAAQHPQNFYYFDF